MMWDILPEAVKINKIFINLPWKAETSIGSVTRNINTNIFILFIFVFKYIIKDIEFVWVASKHFSIFDSAYVLESFYTF